MREFAITPSKIVLDTSFCTKMTGGISSRRCYTKLNFDFPYVRFLSLRRDPYMYYTCTYSNKQSLFNYRPISIPTFISKVFGKTECTAGLGSSTVDQVLKYTKYTKYPKYIPSTSTGQVLIFF